MAAAPTVPPPERLRFPQRRVKTPTVLQMEAVECGAAALGMVLGAFGRYVSLEQLRVHCGVSRDGSKASNILKAARRFGLDAKGFRKEVARLADVPLPAILFWNFNHFVVLEGFGGDTVYLNDPARGPRTVSVEEMDAAFTGVVLTFEKTPEFTRGGEKPSFWPTLRRRVAGAERALLFTALAGLALVVPGLVVPAFAKVFVDDILVAKSKDWFAPLLIGMAVTALMRALLTVIQRFYLLKLESALALAGSGRFLWHVLRLPMEFYQQRFPGDVANRVQLNDRISRLLSGDLASTLIDSVTVVFYAVVMLSYDRTLTFVGVGLAAANAVVLKTMSRRRADESQKLERARGLLMGYSMGGLQMMETIKSGGTEHEFFAQWSGAHARASRANQQLAVYTAWLSVVPALVNALTTASILGLGGLRVIRGDLSIGGLVAFQTLMASFQAPLNKLMAFAGTLQEIGADISRVDDVMRHPEDPLLSGTAATGENDSQTKLIGQVELRGVTFGYSRLDPPLVESFDLLLKPGARVALVGGSGSGKSTIARLICGLYEPWEGEVLFDGKSRAELPRSVLANSLALVDQDLFFFRGTVRENLTLWDATIGEADLVRAGKDAAIHEDVMVRPGGYDSPFDEGGGNWSGGQRQRLEITRALASNPRVLVLDEATSALDAATEKRIDDSLRRRGATCVIVAHRLSTIRDCDEIIVLERGKVVERGTHEQLLAAGGHYKALIEN